MPPESTDHYDKGGNCPCIWVDVQCMNQYTLPDCVRIPLIQQTMKKFHRSKIYHTHLLIIRISSSRTASWIMTINSIFVCTTSLPIHMNTMQFSKFIIRFCKNSTISSGLSHLWIHLCLWGTTYCNKAWPITQYKRHNRLQQHTWMTFTQKTGYVNEQ
jgi:hypothetical protein